LKASSPKGVIRFIARTRRTDWLKLKLDKSQEFVIGGYHPSSGSVIDQGEGVEGEGVGECSRNGSAVGG
jgi:hypothetical protein